MGDKAHDGAVQARRSRNAWGSESTHCRTGTSGSTRSTNCAAVSAMRRPSHEGQKPRPLHEKAATRSRPQPSQCTRTKPWARTPQRRKARSSRATKRGTGRSPRACGALRSVCRRRTDCRANLWARTWSRTRVRGIASVMPPRRSPSAQQPSRGHGRRSPGHIGGAIRRAREEPLAWEVLGAGSYMGLPFF